ncbi:cysteine desulfurase family protein [Pseudemcibacter aquimaris]|uniref:cysteine desulfurase family protein n=1 Tax=Pseudemcibacter aquimaris TaxID=2857064 RepID=UPI00201343FE|nr:cysteine desulfurase family protein [Pseudemcibacter aquimaris]MCC3860918.1 cysteine desulfurase [Pseudemcibacter aquimaris]WDU59737.1 cysteine desulfurase [Pseudemcibacter aquimaris]
MTSANLIYLDYNATAPIRPEVISLMSEVMIEGGNPSSVHALGRKAKSRMETARSQIANVVGCRSQMVIFTSGGTEANNMAILNSGRSRLITTNAEHDSVNSSKDRFNGKVDILNVDQNGQINPQDLERLLGEDASDTVVSILYANNETGVIQNIGPIAKITKAAGALLHLDAIQVFGKIDIDFMKMNVDMMSISSHKIGGPQGVGALIALEKLPVKSSILGGGQEVGRRGGTENIAGIAGFGLAASMVSENLEKMDVLEEWRNALEQRLSEHTDKVRFMGKDANRLPNVSAIYMPDVLSETQVMNFDLEKICISAGSACSSGKVKSSHVIMAMTGDEGIASSTIRMSMGWNTTKDDVDAFVKTWIKLYDRKHA